MDRGVVLNELERFGVEEIELDEPGAGEARVRIEASGVCHSDLHVVRTGFNHPMPVLLGHEGAGVVEAVGEGVEHVGPGDRVVIGWGGGGGGGAPGAPAGGPPSPPPPAGGAGGGT